MQLSSGTQIPDGLLAAIALRNEKPRLGVPSWNPALHQGIDASNSTIVLGLQSTAALNRIGSRSTGKERDSESGLDYFGARYYASSMGRYMSPDWSDETDPVPYAELSNPQTLNLYGYVTNNPLRLYDPTGHDGCCDVLPSMAEVDAGIAYLEGGAEAVATFSAGAVVGTVGLIGQQIFAPSQMGNDPAERRYILMMSKGGNQNHSHTDFAHLSDDEIDALLRDPKTSESDKKKLREQQKANKTRNAAKRGAKKPGKGPVKNDPASVRARQNAAGAAPVVTSTQDNSTVTTTQQDNLPQPKKDPQQ